MITSKIHTVFIKHEVWTLYQTTERGCINNWSETTPTRTTFYDPIVNALNKSSSRTETTPTITSLLGTSKSLIAGLSNGQILIFKPGSQYSNPRELKTDTTSPITILTRNANTLIFGDEEGKLSLIHLETGIKSVIDTYTPPITSIIYPNTKKGLTLYFAEEGMQIREYKQITQKKKEITPRFPVIGTSPIHILHYHYHKDQQTESLFVGSNSRSIDIYKVNTKKKANPSATILCDEIPSSLDVIDVNDVCRVVVTHKSGTFGIYEIGDDKVEKITTGFIDEQENLRNMFVSETRTKIIYTKFDDENHLVVCFGKPSTPSFIHRIAYYTKLGNVKNTISIKPPPVEKKVPNEREVTLSAASRATFGNVSMMSTGERYPLDIGMTGDSGEVDKKKRNAIEELESSYNKRKLENVDDELRVNKKIKLDSIHESLVQALKSSDKELLEEIFETGDRKIIVNSITQLSPFQAKSLMSVIIRHYEMKGSNKPLLLVWMKLTIQEHLIHLVKDSMFLKTVEKFYSSLKETISYYPKFLKLRGKLGVLLVQYEKMRNQNNNLKLKNDAVLEVPVNNQ